MIEVVGLVKRFGLRVILHNLDFSAGPGEFVALLGPNGAGKTTFLRILASLTRPSSGIVRISDHVLPAEAVAVRRNLGFVSHLPLIYGDLTAEENLWFYSQMYTIPSPEQRIQNVLEMVGLSERGRDLARTFSRGMQQRLAIGRAILHEPQLLLLDEPYTGLDQSASEMLDITLRRVVARGQTVLLTSHDLIHAAELASRFDVLSNGRIIASVQGEDLPADGLLAFYRKALKEAV